MTSLPGNPHFDAASDGVKFDGIDRIPTDTRLVRATLALAFEQRTANLLALYADANSRITSGINYLALADTIKNRLGLTESSAL